jgi:hypothetical protein
MTDSWEALFDRASDHGIALEDVRATYEAGIEEDDE